MPLRQIDTSETIEHEQLVDELAREWTTPTTDASAPTIVEQRNLPGKAIHLYVVWDAWRSLLQTDRGEILMDAAERVKSDEDVGLITQAWGLTPSEADALNIKWRS